MRNLLPLILSFLTILGTWLFLPMGATSGEDMKIKHVLSIYSDDKEAGLKHPEGVASSDGSVLIVADSENGRLLRYALQDEKLESAPTEIQIPELLYPIKVHLNSQGDIFALDGKKRRIICMTADGAFKGYINPTGNISAATVVPRSFALDANDHVYIVDILNERVIVLKPSGECTRQLAFPKTYGFISDIAVSPKGDIMLVDSTHARLFAAKPGSDQFAPLTESLKEYVRFPTCLALDAKGRIYVIDRNGGSLILIGPDGSFLGRQSGMGWKEGFLNHPSQICINKKDQIFIADTSNNRIQMFTVSL